MFYLIILATRAGAAATGTLSAMLVPVKIVYIRQSCCHASIALFTHTHKLVATCALLCFFCCLPQFSHYSYAP